MRITKALKKEIEKIATIMLRLALNQKWEAKPTFTNFQIGIAEARRRHPHFSVNVKAQIKPQQCEFLTAPVTNITGKLSTCWDEDTDRNNLLPSAMQLRFNDEQDYSYQFVYDGVMVWRKTAGGQVRHDYLNVKGCWFCMNDRTETGSHLKSIPAATV